MDKAPMDKAHIDKERILIGTSGYSYEDWVGPFYPQGMHKRDFLGFGKLKVRRLTFLILEWQ